MPEQLDEQPAQGELPDAPRVELQAPVHAAQERDALQVVRQARPAHRDVPLERPAQGVQLREPEEPGALADARFVAGATAPVCRQQRPESDAPSLALVP